MTTAVLPVQPTPSATVSVAGSRMFSFAIDNNTPMGRFDLRTTPRLI